MDVAENKKFLVVVQNDETGRMHIGANAVFDTLEEAQKECDTFNTLNHLFPGYTHKVFVEV